jgi:hypothetical protein
LSDHRLPVGGNRLGFLNNDAMSQQVGCDLGVVVAPCKVVGRDDGRQTSGSPRTHVALTSAPASTSTLTQSRQRFATAKCSIRSPLAAVLGSAPCAKSTRMRTTELFRTAPVIGRPIADSLFTLAPRLISNSAASGCSLRMARKRGLAPFVLLFDVSPGVEGSRDGSRVAALHRLVKWAALRSPRIGLPLLQHDGREVYTRSPTRIARSALRAVTRAFSTHLAAIISTCQRGSQAMRRETLLVSGHLKP